MVRLVCRQLIYEPSRTLLTCGAIGSALAVVLLLQGFHSGLLVQLGSVALNRGADLIVAQAGVENFIASRSLLPQLSRARVESVAGVKEAHPITMVPVIYKKQGYRASPIFFVVYDSLGGPARIKMGAAPKQPRDVAIDESLAVLYDLEVGDSFVVSEFEFRIAGIAEQASALFTAFAFIKYDDMIDFFFDSDLVGDISTLPLLSYLLVELQDDADPTAVAAAIERIEMDGDVYTPERIAANDVDLGRALFGPVIGVLIGFGYVIALLVVAMIMFAAAHARLRDFAVMKALGFRDRTVVRQIVFESLAMSLLAIPVALLLAGFGAWVIETRVPLYLVPVLETTSLLRTFSAAFVLVLIGAYLPYRLIAKLDTALVFRD